VSRCLAEIHRRQAVQAKTRIAPIFDVLPSGMPSGFWEKPRNLNKIVPKIDEKHAISIKQCTV